MRFAAESPSRLRIRWSGARPILSASRARSFVAQLLRTGCGQERVRRASAKDRVRFPPRTTGSVCTASLTQNYLAAESAVAWRHILLRNVGERITQSRQVDAEFPRAHSYWLGRADFQISCTWHRVAVTISPGSGGRWPTPELYFPSRGPSTTTTRLAIVTFITFGSFQRLIAPLQGELPP